LGLVASGELGGTDYFGDTLYALAGQVIFDTVEDFDGGFGVTEPGGTDLDGGSPGHDKLESIAGRGDAPAADYRNIDGRRYLIYQV
jgi:hypothetical protein